MSRLLLALFLMVSATCFGASSANLLVDKNCKIWAEIAQTVVQGKNEGLSKDQILGDLTRGFTSQKVKQEVIDSVIMNMGLVYDQQPRGRNPQDIYDATYLACWAHAYSNAAR